MPANPLVENYDAKKVIIQLGGVPVCGYADGSFVNIVANSDRWTRKVGADGEVNRALSNDNTSTIDITLLQTSLSIKYLETVEKADAETGMGMLPLNFTDLNTGKERFWPQAWVVKEPDVGRAKETTDSVWNIHTGQEA
jgi:hypothetical protein